MPDIRVFLEQSYQLASTAAEADIVNVVLGNEACDLDSAVSAICYTLLISQQSGQVTLPVINTTSEDFSLRTEIVFLFEKLGIDCSRLLFRDTFELHVLKEKTKLRIFLVDHNVLPKNDTSLEEFVVGVVDHHKLERTGLGTKLIVEPVGSCCTLVAEQILSSNPELVDEIAATLLYGTILLDTVNLSESAKRATAKDVTIASSLKSRVPEISRSNLYEELLAAKIDTSRLSTAQLLRKDLKVIETEHLCIALSSLPCSVKNFLEKNDAVKHLTELVAGHYNAVIVLGIEIEKEVPKRDISVYCSSAHLRNELSRILEDCREPDFLLNQVSVPLSPCVVYYTQGNSAASRKAILPCIKSAVQSLKAVTEKAMLLVEPGSSQSSSSYNSCPYTPQNSCAEDGDGSSGQQSASGRPKADSLLPSFNSRDMMEKIESKRILLSNGEDNDDEVSQLAYPFTPKNSFVDSSFEQAYQQFAQRTMDAEALAEILKEKQFFED